MEAQEATTTFTSCLKVLLCLQKNTARKADFPFFWPQALCFSSRIGLHVRVLKEAVKPSMVCESTKAVILKCLTPSVLQSQCQDLPFTDGETEAESTELGS